MRIAMLANFLSAHDARIAKQAQALHDAGHRVTLASWVGPDGPYTSLPEAILLDWRSGAKQREGAASIYAVLRGQPHARIDIARAASQRAILEKYLRQGHFDVVIASDPETLLAAARAKPWAAAAPPSPGPTTTSWPASPTAWSWG